MLETIILSHSNENINVTEWVNELRADNPTVEAIMNECINSDLSISRPVLIA